MPTKLKQPSGIEQRVMSQDFRVSDETETPQITGYASVFDVEYDVGYWMESVDPHAFDKVIAKNPDCRALWNHNADCVLGRTTANTLHLSIDNRGLSYVIDPPDTQVARDLMVSMRRKDVTQSSFSFVVAIDQWTENSDGTVSRKILEIAELLDVSPVTYPANPSANSQARSLPESMPKEIRAKFDKRDDPDTDVVPVDGTVDGCVCECAQCAAGACGICSAEQQCANANRDARSHFLSESERHRMHMQVSLLTL